MVMDYKKAGVDVEVGDSLVDWLQSEKSLTPWQTHLQKSTLGGIGGFASLFSLGFKKFQDPVLITCTDGVGTKVKLASYFEDFRGVGQDLVAMCVNDLVCTGGEPILFLDYYATGKLNLEHAKAFLDSVRKACAASDCLLIGGETAEMPGVYQHNDFDCAGFAVGMVEREGIWGAARVKVQDKIVGVSSSGFHSNGYSLVRKLFAEDLEKHRDELLRPTNLYVQLVKKIKEAKIDVHAAAHITGSGVENIPRVIQADSQVVKLQLWEFPPLFKEAQRRSNLTDLEMLKTFNCGFGFCFFCADDQVERLQTLIRDEGFSTEVIGEVESREKYLQNRESLMANESEIWLE